MLRTFIKGYMQKPTTQQRLKAREKPDQNPILLQSWLELLFLHWTYDPEKLQSFLPKGLYVDTYNGLGYVGIVPFFMNDIKPAFFGTRIRGVNFYEMNVRTYVHDDQGNPGVWFFSLDASSRLAVMIAKTFFHLPYFYSDFKEILNEETGWIDYNCSRSNKLKSSYLYKRGALQGIAEQESLEFFLLERYLLFSKDKKGTVHKGRVHHAPYKIYESEVATWDANPFEWNGLGPIHTPPVHQMIATEVNVNIYSLV